MKVSERAFSKILADRKYVVAGKEQAYWIILKNVQSNGYLKPINFEGR